MITQAVNPNAQKEVSMLLEYFNSIEGKSILTGQHTQTQKQEELILIQKETGKLPAICGFELLSYSPNINLEGASEDCVAEVLENRDTLKLAMDWAKKGGILSFTWHWFSPIGGNDKSFYTEHTDFDASLALKEGTKENKAFINDLDVMADLLKPFCENHIPILWRPFHECEGGWFWWGAKGMDVARELYRFMFKYYTQHHHLDNLIWVWNNPRPEGYVGDEYCDIISRDQYPEPHKHSSFNDIYLELKAITKMDKGVAIAETGVIPDGDALLRDKTPWLWYMTWSKDFCLTENHNSFEALRKLYNCENAITLDKLPK
ncbi:MAG: glycoside hydrolase family 26 protein [Treponema sp.]|nr:glycoside hydrolase family 26 protein [Treponema sp.]